MLLAKGLPPFLWDEAVSHAVYIRNRSPTRALKGKTPYEAWTGKKPDVSHFREFGCDVWILDETKNKSKLAPKSQKMTFVGFMEGSKAVRYWDRAARSIKVSQNFVFSENEEPGELAIVEVPGLESEGENMVTPASKTPTVPTEDAKSLEPSKVEEIETPDIQEMRHLRTRSTKIDYRQLNNPSTRQPPNSKLTIRIPPRPSTPATPPNVTRPTEASKAKTKEKANLAMDTLQRVALNEEFAFRVNEDDLPRSYEEALAGDEGEKWKAAMDEEINTLGKMGTWKLEDAPQDRKPVGCKWVFLRKRDEHGQITKYKARLVAQGFSQKPGIDYDNDGTFAPVMRFETLRTLLAYSAVNNLKLRQFDVKGAYLHG